mmetsp:Transcript_20021/g.47714  ORF Transcript_20021/g.47714 Transcript_20021/m.47714 type:complete len:332 (-) Transcript_20021:124-1119(-)
MAWARAELQRRRGGSVRRQFPVRSIGNRERGAGRSAEDVRAQSILPFHVCQRSERRHFQERTVDCGLVQPAESGRYRLHTPCGGAGSMDRSAARLACAAAAHLLPPREPRAPQPLRPHLVAAGRQDALCARGRRACRRRRQVLRDRRDEDGSGHQVPGRNLAREGACDVDPHVQPRAPRVLPGRPSVREGPERGGPRGDQRGAVGGRAVADGADAAAASEQQGGLERRAAGAADLQRLRPRRAPRLQLPHGRRRAPPRLRPRRPRLCTPQRHRTPQHRHWQQQPAGPRAGGAGSQRGDADPVQQLQRGGSGQRGAGGGEPRGAPGRGRRGL